MPKPISKFYLGKFDIKYFNLTKKKINIINFLNTPLGFFSL